MIISIRLITIILSFSFSLIVWRDMLQSAICLPPPMPLFAMPITLCDAAAAALRHAAFLLFFFSILLAAIAITCLLILRRHAPR